MNLDLRNLSQWLKANNLSLNIMKTELIIFHSSFKKTNQSLKFTLDGKRLTQTDTVKYCVILDDYLLWAKQINHVVTKLNQAIDILSKLRSRALRPQDSKDDIPFSFLFSTLGPIKYNQPKQNTETSKQSLEKNIV